MRATTAMVKTAPHPLPSARTLTGERAETRTPTFLVALFVASLIVPNYFYAGSVRLAPFLIVLLVLFIPLVMMWLMGLAGRRILPDWLIAFVCLWSTLALIVAHGVGEALEPAGVIWLQVFGSYLLGRMSVKSAHQLKAVAMVYAVVVLALLPFALFESLTSRPLYLEIFGYLGPTYAVNIMEPRWGLTRAQGAFEHPILFGIFVTSLFGLVFYQARHAKRRLLYALALPAIFATGFVSLSTGALLCLFVQCGLIVWDWMFRRYPQRWRVLMILVVAAYVVVDLLSNRSPFHVFVDYLTFNSGSAYNRILIWQYGTAEVWRHPLFGIGLGDWLRPWWMSPSMDNFWLVMAVRYGLPAVLALAVAFLVILTRLGRADYPDEVRQDLRKGLAISIVGVFVAIGSVHLWNATFCWLMFLMGSAVWLTNPTGKTEPSRRQQNAAEPRPANLRRPAAPPLHSSDGVRLPGAAKCGDRETLRGPHRRSPA